MIVPGPDGRNAVAVANVATPSQRTGIARFADADIRSFAWVNDKRLIIELIDFQAPLGEQMGGGLYAVNADGSDFVYLVERRRGDSSDGHAAVRPLRANHRMVETLGDGSDDVIVERFNFVRYQEEAGSSTLLRLNTATRGTRELVKDRPDDARGWALDRQGVVRAAIAMSSNGSVKVHARTAEGQPWVVIDEYDLFMPKAGAIAPVGFDHAGQLIVSVQQDNEAQTSALHRYDLTTRKVSSAPFLTIKGFDLGDGLVYDDAGRQLIGVRYLSDAAGTAWFDASMKDVQARVDQLLPATNNVVMCSRRCTQQKQWVVKAFSDRQTPIYFLFGKARTGKEALTLIGAAQPWLDAGSMASQDLKRVKTRDGQEMPVYVTRPLGKGPWPTVVMVHGGPYVRGHEWGWAADAQFLASRGYLVVEPEFRGSTGYGDKWFKAGFKQWGLAMQDDITDATQWAVREGLADPKRLVIAGGSYGGYATMMGLVKEPNLYRAGINIVGVTDIELMYDIGWSDFSGSLWQRHGMPQLVGDPSKDRAQLNATSPLKRAAEITKPVLMAYGTLDKRVPLPHGTRMRDAIKSAGKAEVEWVAYEQEGHGFLLEKNLIDFWTRVEAFLAKHAR